MGAIESSSGVKRKEVKAVFETLGSLIPTQLKATGKFTIPGVTMIKLKKKPATKAGKRMAFGKEVFCKAKPARAGEVLHREGAQGRILSSNSPRLADMGLGARSWLWGFPAACLSEGRSGHTGRPNS